MEIKQIILRHLKIELLNPFTTSIGTEYDKDFILVEAQSKSGLSGWGESVSILHPIYNEETVQTNWHMMSDHLIPKLYKPIGHPDEVSERFRSIRGNFNAKSALEGAIWDLYAREQSLPLSSALGGNKDKIEVGISVGIQKSVRDMLVQIEKYVREGYKRIKVKIKPEWDIEVIRAIRGEFPDIQLMADANCAYTLKDIGYLQALDEYDLMMIEQPLDHDDIYDHSKLQAKLKTPICLDESIHTVEDARKAIELGSCRIINLKIGRVGGLSETKKIHDLCERHDVPVWCGGMLEAGVGRAHNIAITTLPNFTLPGDTVPSSHYWKQDIIEPEVTMENGFIHVPDGLGIGYEPDRRKIDELTLHQKSFPLQ